ncbi:hypothetical protein J5N97_025414 [Dioscorea zingiberensis]|uniref:MINDY deubiquitinase domain-containing protein n=1 Tax=Dioscorea zingiberensis TaxID=325984 RepID=A0A9D5C884_9LILI|nr:hypothetical protein J5N97_025414 [Dioscorea zingiberensis]
MEAEAAPERKKEVPEPEEVVYKTKVVEFLGRSTPIVLQNDNGPCPLLAICNVLLLRNNINLNLDASEVSLQKLLSLVAERLIDSNSNVEDKDEEYVNNQQQNIADAIDLLPRLATGIDVNVHFKKINDFEFTRECAIFDLLDIGLYHGWIVDPQDADTAVAIGSKSYNTLVAELVAFETGKHEGERSQSKLEEDFVDFAAATTATLGVPSPSLSRVRSFDDSQVPVLADEKERKGDREEAEELMRVLNLSRSELSGATDVNMPPDTDLSFSSTKSDPRTKSAGYEVQNVSLMAQDGDESKDYLQPEILVSQECVTSIDCNTNGVPSNIISTESAAISSMISIQNSSCGLIPEGSGGNLNLNNSSGNVGTDLCIQKEDPPLQCTERVGSDECYANKDQAPLKNPYTSQASTEDISGDNLNLNNSSANVGTDLCIQKEDPPLQCTDRDDSDECYANKDQAPLKNSYTSQASTEDISVSQTHPKTADNLIDIDMTMSSDPSATNADCNVSNGREESVDVSECVSSLEDSEPIYEGEECILDSQLSTFEDQEPVYEGEIILAEQSEKIDGTSSDNSKGEAAREQWQLIKTFLENNANQLTIYGLFCLQEGLKERELCVFFRNNHFNTMFKFNGELYILATDQGYLNQPDLVWEKLNEVNGDTVFVTGSFKKFNAESQVRDSWNEQNAMSSTADYLASLGASDPAGSTLNSDLQLAIALQQQEFEQQPQRQQQQQPPPPPQNPQQSVNVRSRLVTGPQVPRSSAASHKSESKSKDKCIIM